MAESKQKKGVLSFFGCCSAQDQSKTEVVMTEGGCPEELKTKQETTGQTPTVHHKFNPNVIGFTSNLQGKQNCLPIRSPQLSDSVSFTPAESLLKQQKSQTYFAPQVFQNYPQTITQPHNISKILSNYRQTLQPQQQFRQVSYVNQFPQQIPMTQGFTGNVYQIRQRQYTNDNIDNQIA